MKTRSSCLPLLLALFCPAILSAQWVRVGSDSGLIYPVIRPNDNVMVSLNIDSADVYLGPSVSDSIIKREPSGATGSVFNGSVPDEHSASNFQFWDVGYSDGVSGWTAGRNLTRPIPVIGSLAVMGTNLFVGTVDGGGVYRSTNNGTSWTDINAGMGISVDGGNPHVYALAVSGTNIFAGTDVYAYRSTNSGTSWTILTSSGMPGMAVPFLVSSRTCLFAKLGSSNTFNFRLTNNGTSWEPITCPGEIALIDTNLFAEHGNGDIDLSTDNGTTWTKVFSGGLAEQSWDFCASGNYLYNINSGTDPHDCVARMLWNGSSVVYAGGMIFPAGYAPCSLGVGDIRATGTNVFLNYGNNYFSTNSGTNWSAISLPPGVSIPGRFVTLGTNLFMGATGIWRNSLFNALPIQLASFKVAPLGSVVALAWTTVSETNNYGFYVQRDGTEIAFIAGHGTTLQPHTYSYTDNPPAGRYQYRLRQVDRDGAAVFSESVTIGVAAPGKFALNQNYPDPFNPSTRISFSITKEGPVSLRVYDLVGREVATLVNQNRKPGEYTEQFNGSQMASGVYVYVLRSPEGQLVGRMMLLR